MPNSTPRLALLQQVGTDGPIEIRLADTANTNTLDNAAIYREGLLAARPLANSVATGTVYRASDDHSNGTTGSYAVSDGTSWNQLRVGAYSTGIFSNRPAANAVIDGAVYRATDTGAFYVSNGASWVEYALYASGTDAGKPSAGSAQGTFYYATDTNTLYFSDGATWRTPGGSRGSSIIAGSNSRTSTTYGAMGTPDQVQNIVLTSSGKLTVTYQATWSASAGNGFAAIFLNANQVVEQVQNNTGPAGQEAQSAGAGVSQPLSTGPTGLASGGGTSSVLADATTGQLIGWNVPSFPGSGNLPGGSCEIFAAAGTYTVGVNFRSTSGSVTVSNRRLYVEAKTF